MEVTLDKIFAWHLNGFPDGSNPDGSNLVVRKSSARLLSKARFVFEVITVAGSVS